MRITPVLAVALLAGAATAAAGAQAPSHKPLHKTHAVMKSQAELQKEAKMTMADARAMALATVPNSTVKTGEIEREGGKLIYSFDMNVAGKTGIDEVNIDAMTGKLVSSKHETPRAERAEAKVDAKEAKAQAKEAKADAKEAEHMKGMKPKP